VPFARIDFETAPENFVSLKHKYVPFWDYLETQAVRWGTGNNTRYLSVYQIYRSINPGASREAHIILAIISAKSNIGSPPPRLLIARYTSDGWIVSFSALTLDVSANNTLLVYYLLISYHYITIKTTITVGIL
jgi:hypothetical protein